MYSDMHPIYPIGDFKLGKEVTEVRDKGLNLTPGPGELTAKR